MRLQAYMAKCGVASRRACEKYIKEGRVKVNNQKVTRLGTQVNECDIIKFNDVIIKPENKLIYIVVNKPEGYLCAKKDKWSRPLVDDLFVDSIDQRLFHVGRLDYNSSGLIFYTNDGDFARFVTHPSSEIEKDYIVYTKVKIPDLILKRWLQGLEYNGQKYKLKRYRLLSPKKVLLTLTEGKNREIRKIFEQAEIEVNRLNRIRIGIVTLKNIKRGKYRHLNRNEVEWFLQNKHLDHYQGLCQIRD